MKIKNAFLCLDCDEVFQKNKNNETCPVCGNKYSVKMSKYILPLHNNNKIEKELNSHDNKIR